MRLISQTGLVICLALLSLASRADSVEELNAKAINALDFLSGQVEGVEVFLSNAAGVLVFPNIVKVGFGSGGQYGEGVLLVEQKPDAYYSRAGATFGLQLGTPFKSEVIVFVTQRALAEFRQRRGFEVGIDGSVALVTMEAVATLFTGQMNDPVVGFIFSNEGLMSNLSLEGAKITKLAR